MQSLILLTLLSTVTLYSIVELRRDFTNDKRLSIVEVEQLAGNFVTYIDLLKQYIVKNYEKLGLHVSTVPDMANNIRIINYAELKNYSQTNFIPLIKYKSMVFNYLVNESGNLSPPVSYYVISWESADYIYSRYKMVNFAEVMSNLNSNFNGSEYQSSQSSTLNIPWIFNQNNCHILEFFVAGADDKFGRSREQQFSIWFKRICNQIQNSGEYNFGKYVYMQSILK